jgi:DNA invertase Pin-like site-specific DNA recombinase
MAAEQKTAAVGYLRVASGSQRKREESLRIQRQAILRYATIHGAEIMRLHFDQDSAHDITQQHGLRDALQSLRSGRASLLIVENLHRLTGASSERLRFIARHFGTADGPALISIKERIDSRTSEGRLMLGIADVMARWELDTKESGAGHV